MIRCRECGGVLDNAGESCRVASISTMQLGDEYTETYYRCPACDVYTIEQYDEPFMGEGHATLDGPVPRELGDSRISVIRRCPEPWNKSCDCPAHREYFGRV
jgi:hypothetical protein